MYQNLIVPVGETEVCAEFQTLNGTKTIYGKSYKKSIKTITPSKL